MNKEIIMLLTNSFCPDPRVYKEAKYLISKGFKVTILCWHRDNDVELKDDEIIDGIRVIRFHIVSKAGSGFKQIPAFLKYIWACRKYLAKHPCDYLHGNDLDGSITAFIARTKKTPIVFDMHEFYEDFGFGNKIKSKILRLATIFMIKRSIAAIRTNDLYLRPPYKSIQDKLYLLKNFPDSNLIKRLPKTDSEKFRIGYHGGLREQIPEFTTLFEAVKGMDDVAVDIYGKGPDLEGLRKISANYENVTIHGRFDGARQLSGLYANSDIVYAGYRPDSDTKDEQEMVKFFECILTGTPMILTKIYRKMGNEVEKYGFGLTCDTRNVEDVKKCVIKMKDDVEFRKKCSEAEIRQSYKYDWNEAVSVLDQIFL